MFDVFYIGPKPDLFAHEQRVENIEQAQQQSRTRFFWVVSYLVDYTGFDFLFEPVPWQSQYTHTWPSQWDQYYGACLVPTHVDKIEYHNHDHLLPAKSHPENYHKITDCEFDQHWLPHPWDPPYIYVFGNQWHRPEIMPTIEYHTPGATERKFIQWPRASLPIDMTNWTVPVDIDTTNFDFSWLPDPGSPSYVYQFGTQHQRTGGPVYSVPGATEVKYVQYPRSTKINTDPYWTIPTGADTTSFDWTWHPNATEPAYIYQFGTQHQRTGGPIYTVPGAVEVKYVEQIKIKVDSKSAVIIEIDHLDGNTTQIPNTVKTIRYFDNYRDTLIRIANSLLGQYEFVWICSSICDYAGFDFSWHPEQWQSTMLHVFASNEQKFGDTFYMHVPSFAEYAERKELLEWYDCNFVDISVPRRHMPIIKHNLDSHVDAVKTMTWPGPIALFVGGAESPVTCPAVNLWRAETKTLIPLDPGANAVIVPRTAVLGIKTQLYDYAYIDKTKRSTKPAQLQDVIFVSYDEPEAEGNWKKLQDKCPRAKRVHGIEGMENALAAAAELSSTPWYFCVFGKTELYPGFDFTFQPDYFQQPKHYIFYSENRVNKLVYGEMAVIMYNCNLILDNRDQEFGLDYTLSFPHEVIPLISTYGNFNTSPYHTWRTAFREVSKLYDQQEKLPSVETEYRIKIWETVAEGDYAEWALTGAKDGREFYKKYKDDFAYRKNSFHWQWLRNYFSTLYGEVN
jgi:hypothetical protein